MQAPADVQALTRFFKALSDETRLRIVGLLGEGELCVCHIEAALELSQPMVSRHLATLRAAGIVEARREGTWMHYRLAAQSEVAVQAQLRLLKGTLQKRATDTKRLQKIKGRIACP